MTDFPLLGARPSKGKTQFAVWAPSQTSIDVCLEKPGTASMFLSLDKHPEGLFTGAFPAPRTGDRYRYRLSGGPVYPDPASRFQPEGVHGASMIVDSQSFQW